jgi:hypothetical protein
MPTAAHEKLYEDALAAVNNLFADTTVDPHQTHESLQELIGEIRIMLNALDSDISNNSAELLGDDGEELE